jgi:hypothetical protein
MTWQQIGDVARDVMEQLDNPRVAQIDTALGAAGELICALMEQGPINSKQARLIAMAAVKAKVSNAQEFEVRERAALIVREDTK